MYLVRHNWMGMMVDFFIGESTHPIYMINVHLGPGGADAQLPERKRVKRLCFFLPRVSPPETAT